VKIAPIMEEMARYPEHFQQVLVHTGQHYDDEMSQVFFDDLGIPRPSAHLPCLTLREHTGRPVTVTQGTNTIVGCDPGRIVTEALAILDSEGKAGRVPELWDGRATGRIVDILELWEGAR